MRLHLLCSAFLIFGLFCVSAGATSFPAEPPPSPVSKTNLIQNVQNYSSSPFWKPGTPYNQKFPQPIYVRGPDLTAGDCQSVVSALVANYCSTHNNCIDLNLGDVRPALVVQLANLPGYNYVTACSGFIDEIFQTYKFGFSSAAPIRRVDFPNATVPNPNVNTPAFKINNPFVSQAPVWNNKPWAKEYLGRKQELQNLQAQNGAGTEHIEATNFPQSAADISLVNQINLKREGYEPFRDKSPYHPIKIESEADYLARMKSMPCSADVQARYDELKKILAELKLCKSEKVEYKKCIEKNNIEKRFFGNK